MTKFYWFSSTHKTKCCFQYFPIRNQISSLHMDNPLWYSAAKKKMVLKPSDRTHQNRTCCKKIPHQNSVGISCLPIQGVFLTHHNHPQFNTHFVPTRVYTCKRRIASSGTDRKFVFSGQHSCREFEMSGIKPKPADRLSRQRGLWFY